MTEGRKIPLDELNKIIDEKVKEYENTAEECYQELDDPEQGKQNDAKAEALKDLKVDINDPSAFIDTSENIQQSVNVNDAQNIANNDLPK